MNRKIVVAVDAMGGDNAPAEIVKGAAAALDNSSISVILTGREDAVKRELAAIEHDASRVSIVNATEVIGMDEVPTAAVRQKKDSSMAVGLRLVKEGAADAFVSAGSTGALLTGATLIVGRIKGIERPALGVLLPNMEGSSLLIDCGANVDAKPSYLAQFGKMGAVYMETVMRMPGPRVALVNIGAEREKGSALVKEAYGLLEESGLNFLGNIEARDIPFGNADVLVCDAFTGNVLLKHSEGLTQALLAMIKRELMSSAVSKAGALLSKGAFKRLKRRFDADDVGGAPFLGLNGLVVKAHGGSNARAIKGAIGQCAAFVENGFVSKLEERI